MRRLSFIKYGVWLAALTSTERAIAQSGTALDVKATGTKSFYVNNRAGNSQITILSESTLEDFTTVCNKVSGQCQLDPKHLESIHGRFSIRIADMRTGIELRDEHLRSPDWLDANKFPEVVIEVSNAEEIKKTGSGSASMTLVAKCSIRGQSRPVRIPCTITYLDESPTTMKIVKGDVIRLRAEFNVKLSDFGVSGPKGSETIGMKVSDVQRIKVSIFAATQAPPRGLTVDRESATSAPSEKPSR